jgi:hypothetical protein
VAEASKILGLENALVMFYSVVHVVYIDLSMQYPQGISKHEPTYLPTYLPYSVRLPRRAGIAWQSHLHMKMFRCDR